MGTTGPPCDAPPPPSWRLVACFLACAWAACRPAPPAEVPPLVVGRLSVDVALPAGDGPPPGATGGEVPAAGLADATALRALLRSVLAQDPSVREAEGEPQARGLGLALRGGPLGPEVELELASATGHAPWVARVPLAALGAGDGAAAGRAAMVAAWVRLADLRRLEAQEGEALVAAIDHPDPRIGAAAMDLCAARGEGRAVAPICRRLAGGVEPEALLRGIGALVAIGDATAVPTLIDLTLHQEPPFLVQSAFAIGALGGPLAEAYLMTLAAGHPDDEVARAARDALAAAPP